MYGWSIFLTVLGSSSTPILRMKQGQIRTTKAANPGISVLQGTAFTATPQGGGYAIQSTTDITMASQEMRWFRTNVMLYPASDGRRHGYHRNPKKTSG
ncbi:uncharacterized protein LOC121232792 isoform X2 [Aquila chrysaetos chrysaetos]|uniref:uncharacterized protein LOC121232792 isoform X2 n=1 Tax=Aquila chrysaetos chrysaetos TaxID=223781 RepID=UPI001B7D4583|nr:uncharacterized protein LOC121232792 isoform X2 [Aquila chrysaetos chrysaetos]